MVVGLRRPLAIDLPIEDGEVIDFIEVLNPVPGVQAEGAKEAVLQNLVEPGAGRRLHDGGQHTEVEVGVLEPSSRRGTAPHVGRVEFTPGLEHGAQLGNVRNAAVARRQEVAVSRPIPDAGGVGQKVVDREGNVRVSRVDGRGVEVIAQRSIVVEDPFLHETGRGQRHHRLADRGHPVGRVAVDRQVAPDVPLAHVGFNGEGVSTSGHDTHAGEVVGLEDGLECVVLGRDSRKEGQQGEQKKRACRARHATNLPGPAQLSVQGASRQKEGMITLKLSPSSRLRWCWTV